MKKLFTLIILIGLIANLSCKTQNYNDYSLTYKLLKDSDSVGYMKVNLKWNKDQGLLNEITSMGGFYENSMSYFNKELKMDSIRILGNMGSAKIDCFSKEKNGFVIGHVGFPIGSNGTRNINNEIEVPNFYERSVSLLIYPMKVDQQNSIEQIITYNATSGKFYNITVTRYNKNEIIKYNKKNYECKIIEYSGGIARQKFYIYEGFIVRIDIIGQPYTYELIKKRASY